MLKEIKLYGKLAKYGKSIMLDVDTPQEAIRALLYQIKGFAQELKIGKYILKTDNKNIGLEECVMTFGSAKTLSIIPVVAGSKNNGVFKIILGVALIGISFVAAGLAGHALFGISQATFMTLGAGMVLNGIGQLLSPSPSVDSAESAADKPSYLFGGAVNLTQEGNIVPVCYGTCWCGSVVISSGFNVREVR